jgi:hypothetical protein
MTPKDELSSSHFDAKLSEFEKKLERLYRTYEQYFIGVEKRPPHAQRREVVRMYRELEQLPMVKTAIKFRFRSLVQRFNSYKAYWNRTEKQIEEGTYHRDLARAKARQQRRQDQEQRHEPEERSGQAEDGAFEIDDLDLENLDLGSMEEELQQMDQRGEFEKYVGTQKMKRDGFPEDEQRGGQAPNQEFKPAPRGDGSGRPPQRGRQGSSSWERPKVDENVKQKKLAELQAKLGLSTRGNQPSQPNQPNQPSQPSQPAQGGNNPFERSAEGPTQKARPENPSAPSRGADMSKLRKLRRAKERLEKEKQQRRSAPQRSSANRSVASQARSNRDNNSSRTTGSNRVIRRNSSASAGSGGFSEEKSRKIYNNLVEAKRRCKEDTSNLNYDTFKRTMEKQRSQIQKKKGARDVDFKVVIKDGRAFLKPETKK